MMLLQYAIMGSWQTLAGKYFTDPAPKGLGFSGAFVGFISSLLPIGYILSPLLIGQLADKYFRSDRLQSVLCALSGVVLLLLSQARTELSLFWLMLAFAFLFAPTTTLTNTIAFHHLQNPAKEFGIVRVGGTIGFFVALAGLSVWRGVQARPITGDIFMLAGVFALVFGLYGLTLPKTLPQHSGKTLPLIDALSLFRDRNFRIYSALAFLLACNLDFYYIFASAYIGAPRSLGGIGVSSEALPILMTLPQISEIIVMVSLGASLPKLGVKRAFVIGFFAWVLRYVLFAASPQLGFAVGGLFLHGICFTFVFAVASLYVNEVAPPAIRASAQALVTVGLFGFGRFFGSLISGYVQKAATTPLRPPVRLDGVTYDHATNWTLLFSVPIVATLIAAVLMVLLFRDPTDAPLAPAA
jgi:nucleoside transporter